MFKEIAVYQDDGVDKRSFELTLKSLQRNLSKDLYKIRTCEASYINGGNWQKKTALFVLPGGRDLFYLKKLAPKGTDAIRSFVEEGGAFLGICAGAYFASSSIEFEKDGEYEVLGERPLKFYPGRAIGPAYGNGKYEIGSDSGFEAASIQLKDGPCHLYFNGGCYFENAHLFPDVTIHGIYQDVKNAPAAIISRKVGKGNVFLSGVHFEYCTKDFAPVHPLLKKDDAQREELFLLALEKLGIGENQSHEARAVSSS